MTRFHNLTCTTCKADTLHYAGKCQTCGTLFVFPSAQRRRARVRHIMAVRYGRTAHNAFREARQALEAERPVTGDWRTGPGGGRPVNGYRNERTKV